jgi:hypothetical protein
VSDERAQTVAVNAIRRAFASGQPAAGEALLEQALSDGVAWDVATRAVADGVAQHYRSRNPREEQAGGTFDLA